MQEEKKLLGHSQGSILDSGMRQICVRILSHILPMAKRYTERYETF